MNSKLLSKQERETIIQNLQKLHKFTFGDLERVSDSYLIKRNTENIKFNGIEPKGEVSAWS